jgi:hypothetical protein
MKRILDCQVSDFQKMSGMELKDSIRAAEGRTILSECIVSWTPLLRDVSNPEVARSEGADLLLLNYFDMNQPMINGIPEPHEGNGVVQELKRLTGRPVGVNLEPVDKNAIMMDGLVMLSVGTSQEGSSVEIISQIALHSKMAGADIFHLGDAGILGIANLDNIVAASNTLRGRRHTWRRMATSSLH